MCRNGSADEEKEKHGKPCRVWQGRPIIGDGGYSFACLEGCILFRPKKRQRNGQGDPHAARTFSDWQITRDVSSPLPLGIFRNGPNAGQPRRLEPIFLDCECNGDLSTIEIPLVAAYFFNHRAHPHNGARFGIKRKPVGPGHNDNDLVFAVPPTEHVSRGSLPNTSENGILIGVVRL